MNTIRSGCREYCEKPAMLPSTSTASNLFRSGLSRTVTLALSLMRRSWHPRATGRATDPDIRTAGVRGCTVARVTILDDARPGMNPDIRPQDDLFGHVNGRWLDTTDIPADRSAWGAFVILADQSEARVKKII